MWARVITDWRQYTYEQCKSCPSVSSVSLSVCLVSPVKIFEWKFLKSAHLTIPVRGNDMAVEKLMYVYLIETKAAHSSAFPAHFYNTGTVHHFHTVNHLYTVESRHMRTPSTCSRSPVSLFPARIEKSWVGAWEWGNHSLHSRGWLVTNHIIAKAEISDFLLVP